MKTNQYHEAFYALIDAHENFILDLVSKIQKCVFGKDRRDGLNVPVPKLKNAMRELGFCFLSSGAEKWVFVHPNIPEVVFKLNLDLFVSNDENISTWKAIPLKHRPATVFFGDIDIQEKIDFVFEWEEEGKPHSQTREFADRLLSNMGFGDTHSGNLVIEKTTGRIVYIDWTYGAVKL